MRTIDECRDWLAADEGWRIFTEGLPVPHYLAPGKPEDADCQVVHPIPATLDAAAEAMPEGWGVKVWVRGQVCTAEAWSPGDAMTAKVVQSVGSNEIEARFNLAVLVRKERERQISKCMGRCKHFNGVQNKKCEVGIDYETFRVNGGALGLPCLKHLGEHRMDCPMAEYPTTAEAEQELADREKSWQNICDARKSIVDHLGGPWKKGMAGSVGVIDCPICKSEKSLHFSRSGYNGHIHAGCATTKCVSWME